MGAIERQITNITDLKRGSTQVTKVYRADTLIWSFSSLDPDAQAYINAVIAAGGTLSTPEQTAINNFYVGLKADGLYTLLDRVYPFIGGSANTNKIEMKAPSTNDLVFNGSWTHSTAGSTAAFDITCFADTGFNIGTTGTSTVTSDFSFGVIKNRIGQTDNLGYSGAGFSDNYVIIGNDGANLDNFYNTNLKVPASVGNQSLSILNSVFRDGTESWRTAYKEGGTSVSTGMLISTANTNTYTQQTGSLTLTLNKVNNLSGFQDAGLYSFSWIGKNMTQTQKNNYLIRINDLLNGFGRNIFTA